MLITNVALWFSPDEVQFYLVDARGKETTQYYSEASSYLIGNISTQSSPMGEMEVSVKMGDYKEFGGVMFPTTQVMNQMGMEIKTTVEEVTFDEIDPSVFEPPDSIKALMN